MLKELGASLLEMLIVMLVVALFFIGIADLVPRLCSHFFSLCHRQQIRCTTHQVIWPLVKDIRRASFFSVQKIQHIGSALKLNGNKYCVTIRYDLVNVEHRSYSVIYCFKNENIEVSSETASGRDKRWYKLFDPKELRVIAFNVLDYDRYAEIVVKVSLRKNAEISYTLVQAVRYENR